MPIPAIVGAAAISGGTGLINSILNRRNSRRDAKLNRNFAREMSDQKWQRDTEAWHRQNEYNSPTAQMQRLKEAGLNPNLMYGQGTTGNSSSMPTYQAPDYKQKTKALQLPETIAMYQNIKARSQQINLMQKDSELKEQDVINKQLIGEQIQQKTKDLRDKNRLFNDLYDYSLQGKEYEVGKKREEVEYKRGQIIKLNKELNILENKKSEAKSRAEIKKYEALIKQKEAEMFQKFNIHPKESSWFKQLLYMIIGQDAKIEDFTNPGPLGQGSLYPVK